MDENMKRELSKVLDVLKKANQHFQSEALMNAALHMAETVRPAPLAVAVQGAMQDLERLIGPTVTEKEESRG